MMHKAIKQLDIWWVDLEPTRGAETQKNRPCVVLQGTQANKGSRTTIVAPLLPEHKSWSFVVNVAPSTANGLDKNRHINLKQLRVVDLSRVGRKQGVLESAYMSAIREALDLIFWLEEGDV